MNKKDAIKQFRLLYRTYINGGKINPAHRLTAWRDWLKGLEAGGTIPKGYAAKWSLDPWKKAALSDITQVGDRGNG